MSQSTQTGQATDQSADPHAASACPVCTRPNRCAQAFALVTGAAQPACWCITATIDPARLSGPAARRAPSQCLCATCAGVATAG